MARSIDEERRVAIAAFLAAHVEPMLFGYDGPDPGKKPRVSGGRRKRAVLPVYKGSSGSVVRRNRYS